MPDTDPLSLYHEVRARGYEASIIGTYSLSFQLYERVVLRRLQASGCRHNILLADAGQCAKELTSSPTRPRFCGSDYALLPVRLSGSFHPKFILLLGRRQSRLIIGSHNVTLAGFGLNREITTAFDVQPSGPTGAAAREVWRFVRAWTSAFSSRMQDVVAATERVAPWLAASNQEQTPYPTVLCTLPSGPTLWQRLKPLMRQPVKRIFIISPYFDSRLRFLQTLEKELSPKECVVAVHPKFTEIAATAPSLVSRSRFVDITQFGETWAEDNLHAKVYRFELAGGSSIVVTGSANASDPAWQGTPATRNAEVIVVHQDGEQVWKRLGLSRLSELPDVNQSGWESIRLRAMDKKERNDPSHETPFIATVTPNGFAVDSEFVRDAAASNINVVTGDERKSSIEKIETKEEECLCFCADEATRTAATYLEVVPSKGRPRIALVHHVDGLLDRAAGDVRQAFRRSLSGLEGDPDQLSELIHVVEKAIFDQPFHLEEESERFSGKGAHQRTVQKGGVEPESLMIAAKNTIRARRRRRLSATSDLALIIDALIYRLGLGLRPETDSPTSVQPSEEALRDQNEQPPQVDGHTLAKLCRGKVNRLFRRMIAQLELASGRGSDATTPLIQLAAVLGVVKHLRVRQVNFEWLPKGEQIVDADHQWEFFKKASQLLYAPAHCLAAKALAEHGDREFDELTAVRALLSWLAFDGGLDTRNATDRALVDPELVRENLTGAAYFLPVIVACSSDKYAADVLADVTAEGRGDVGRVAYHVRWAQELARSIVRRRTSPSPVGLGDIAYPLKVEGVSPSVVVDVQYDKAGLLDLDSGMLKYFKTGYLVRVHSLGS